jgi:DNA polymerase I
MTIRERALGRDPVLSVSKKRSPAVFLKRAMINVDRWNGESGIDAKLIMQVHDELVLEVAGAAVEEVCRQIGPLMAEAAALTVPLRVEIGVGQDWEEAH